MSEPSGQSGQSGQEKQRSGWAGGSGDSWERRAADLANEVQRWLIRSSARNMRDELGGQVKKAFRGQDHDRGDVWATATTEPPDAADQPPECAWCPICRAARRMAQAQAQAQGGGGGGGGVRASGAAQTPADAAPRGAVPGLAGAAEVLVGAARDALSGLDAILSYRPAEASRPEGANGASPNGASSEAGASSAGASSAGAGGPGDGSSDLGDDHEPDHRG